MKTHLVILLFLASLAAAAAIVLSCSTDPCEDLQVDAENCADPEVKNRGLAIVTANDKNDCRLYRDVWYVTFLPRCESYADGGVIDAGITDGGTADAGISDTGIPDTGTDDTGTPDAGADDTGTPDAGADV